MISHHGQLFLTMNVERHMLPNLIQVLVLEFHQISQMMMRELPIVIGDLQ